MPILLMLKSYLDQHHVAYESIHHRRDYTSQEAAADTHTPGKEFAKTVILAVDDRFGMFVLPAIRQVDLEKVKRKLGAKKVRLASEDELAKISADCEVGAMPPFGTLYELPVYVSPLITQDRLITFNAGTHEDAVRMLYSDYEKLAQPQSIDFTIDRETS
jgi:Ala-tRNA(Pro) deacylase